MPSKETIRDHIQSITNGLDDLASGNGNLSMCVEIGEQFNHLRDYYRKEPESMTDFVGRLGELSKRFDALLAERSSQIVDHFHRINERLRLVEQEKQFWRDFLIRQATESRNEYLNGSAASVRVKSNVTRSLPSAQSNERIQLEDLIRESGCWDKVSQLSGPKLNKALENHLLPDNQAATIEQLCPTTVIHQVSSRVLEK